MKFEEETKINVLKEDLFGKMIYFLIKNNTVIYVGQSVKGINRPVQHYNKSFDYFTFIAVKDEDDLNRLERYYILKYKPKYNKTVPKLSDEISFTEYYYYFCKFKTINSYHKVKKVIIEQKLYSCMFNNQMLIKKNMVNTINDLIKNMFIRKEVKTNEKSN